MNIEYIKQNAEKTGKCGDALSWWQLGGDLYIEGQGEIYMDAFSGDDSIRRVKIAPGCTGIGIGAFLDCELESVELPDGLVRIDALAFSVGALLSLTIPDSVTSIDFNAFENVDEIIYGGRALPEDGNENWGAARWTGRLVTLDFGYGPLCEDHTGTFGSIAIDVYDNAVEWGGQTPVPGEEMDVVVRYPFYCTVGDPFWADFHTYSFMRKLHESRFVQAKLLSVQESDEKSAKVRIMILQGYDVLCGAGE